MYILYIDTKNTKMRAFDMEFSFGLVLTFACIKMGKEVNFSGA